MGSLLLSVAETTGFVVRKVASTHIEDAMVLAHTVATIPICWLAAYWTWGLGR